jgi:hypothetical protein
MTAVVIPFLGRGRGDPRCMNIHTDAPVLTNADVDLAQQSIGIIAPDRLLSEAMACLDLASMAVGTRGSLVWEVRAFFCLSRMLDAALPPERRAQT